MVESNNNNNDVPPTPDIQQQHDHDVDHDERKYHNQNSIESIELDILSSSPNKNNDHECNDEEYQDDLDIGADEIESTTYYHPDGKKKSSSRYCQLIKPSDKESETDQTVLIPNENKGFSIKKLFSFLGPAVFVSIGYMDPGNWATDLEGGSRFGYQLVWVLLMSNIMAMLLQILSFKIALVTKKDLAQMCGSEFPKAIKYVLWVIIEIAITSTDLAEVIGTAVALQILFGIPLIAGVLITALDTLLFLLIQRWGIRKLEFIVLGLLTIIAFCFIVELFMSKPNAKDVFKGFIPTLSKDSIMPAIGIIGATIMPHNLFLHSGVVKSRKIGKDNASVRQAFKYNIIDTVVALNTAFFVNASIIILAGAVFYENGVEVSDLSDAYKLLENIMNSKVASIMFGVGLLCAGQASTITGTMAGQIVMEGFIQIKLPPWVRRLVTRLLAIIPAVIVILAMGPSQVYNLLIISQVILSIALPFAIVPLIKFTSDREIMGEFVNRIWITVAAIIIALILIGLNMMAIVQLIQELIETGLVAAILTYIFIVPLVVAFVLLLVWVIFYKQTPTIIKFIKCRVLGGVGTY
ncbi:hypothetical protein SAMD00019534_081480 [Acytostelium subglobosum LB1]|uniref:hypothetical protein n=1 Tax=Acytostelium subglobosum LB1 TaxID=1410327 RepID=UPI000644BA56|nr:hypothetical protein SAMD00019534_081480 [Acytostelium subglobosum LB1]GAM24973.1 hypothetical protein SAMD00019534_081480 [Acytostelium subglobosum LB1]|eukprot:XP_012752062.1 hypothetical protein SAMD00019534_081480 [Acytostelium subglobosum LB1]